MSTDSSALQTDDGANGALQDGNQSRSVLHVSGLTKRFGGTAALDRAVLTLRAGTVHALVGGNGSGKSTIIKVLAGVHRADSGRIETRRKTWDASEYGARSAWEAGFRFVHQDLGLFPELSVAENVALQGGYPTRGFGRIRWSTLNRHVRQLLDAYEIDADPTTPVGALAPAQRTLVAICRALQDPDPQGRLILVLDEPTAALPHQESIALLDAVRRRAERGQTVLLVSHRMPEVLTVSDDFTVFRDGRTVAQIVDRRPEEEELVSHMTGSTRPRLIARPPTRSSTDRAPYQEHAVLAVRGLHGGPLRGVDLEVRRGEVVGVTGLVGSGRSSLLRTVFGQHRPVAGEIIVHGAAGARSSAGTGARMRAGVSFVPEDRPGDAAFAQLSIRDNLSVTVRSIYWRLTGMNATKENADARELVHRYRVRSGAPEAPFSVLSGGNQQKVILARWLRRRPSLLLLDEPTQGVDVMSRVDIYDAVREAAARGCGVLVASSDLDELAVLCDRVLVIRDGRIAAELADGELTADALLTLTQMSDAPPTPSPRSPL
ncbi:sugar ABC transporter ATP-binding protein [Cellulomonas sp. URHD0024]|uniref:sugar ABC transporter ATP-binding protein n=1 Tax=Cellulomonas sp. URHD0024 TaxID=1302620 RepID=UPI00041580CA|nr:sugar ABC transporter ATP-binding protein [Cellulomonas sp. URHD0024]